MRRDPGSTRRAGTLVAALLGAWVASCGADVDAYHFDPTFLGHAGSTGESGGTGSGGDQSSAGGGAGGGAPNGGMGARQQIRDGGTGGSGGVGGSDTGGVGSGGAPETGGTGDGGREGSGGTGGGATGGVGNGGSNSGGSNSGGIGNGGASSGGASNGGASSGGASSGGTSSGGASSGGASSGGASSGGASSGGAGGAGATGPGDLVWIQPDQPLGGITAAAWRPTESKFYLLESASNRFWTLGVTTNPATRGGPFSLPAGSVFPKVFGVNGSDVYVVISNSVNRVAKGGSTSATTVVALGDSPLATTVTGAYAGGYLFIAESAGATHVLQDGQATLTGGTSGLTSVNNVATDGASFAFRTNPLSGTLVNAHLIAAAGPYARNSAPCAFGNSGTNLTEPTGISGNRVAWVTQGGTSCALKSATITGGQCDAVPTTTSFGQSSTCGRFVGLIDDQYALVLTNVSLTTADVEVKKVTVGTVPLPVTGVQFGAKGASGFVMGPPNHAIILSGDVPALISY